MLVKVLELVMYYLSWASVFAIMVAHGRMYLLPNSSALSKLTYQEESQSLSVVS